MNDVEILKAYSGRRFGERVVLDKIKVGNRGNRLLLCRCDNGHEAFVKLAHINAGTGGRCKTCHCRRIATRHGEAGSDISKSSPTYKAWVNMICRVNRDESYTRRAISVCERWKIFENFKADMGDPPDRRMELDRKDGTKGYSPENCRWLTRAQNNKNRTNLRMISFAGMTMCVADWEKYLNITPDRLRKKLRFKRPLATIMAECGFYLHNPTLHTMNPVPPLWTPKLTKWQRTLFEAKGPILMVRRRGSYAQAMRHVMAEGGVFIQRPSKQSK